jgi:hypothetical protein
MTSLFGKHILSLARPLSIMLASALWACSAGPDSKKPTSSDIGSVRQTDRPPPTARSPSDSAATGPSLGETIAWLSKDALPMLTLTEIGSDRANRMLVTTKHKVSSLTVNDCVLNWTTRISFTISSPAGETADPGKPFTQTVPLKAVDVGGISVVEMPPSQRSDEPTQRIRIPTRGKEGPPDGIDVRNRVDGERVVKALKRAAILCGAESQPF